jgi:hypothetical protein
VSLGLSKVWRDLSEAEIQTVGGELGVYEIGDATGQTLYIGFAGGNSTFGLRGEMKRQLNIVGPGRRFRVEINMQYLSRWDELLAVHEAVHGRLPSMQGSDKPARIGRLHPHSH